jgi:tRNA dimethylallyltransferase
MKPRPQLLAIVGLTGTGKTELACEVARRSNAEIIGVDSMQVYRGMDIGTAKPTPELRGEIPHHAIDIVDPDDPMSAGRYAELARRAAREILSRGRPVILCGGTGLYARAFAGGLVEGVASDPAIKAELEEFSTEELYAELQEHDPAGAAAISGSDRVRVLRALEAFRITGSPFHEQKRRHGFADQPFEIRWLALDLERAILWERIRLRVDRMFETGLVDEVRALYARGYGRNLRSLQSIGYRQVGQLLAGELTEAQAREAICVATRRYAKRQRTWFRAEPGLRWLDAADRRANLDLALSTSSR